MKILVDTNLSPLWVAVFEQQGWEAIHWSTIGDPRATDSVIMEWARVQRHIVFTHDLDFGTLLATTRAGGPSVIQVRTQDVMPEALASRLIQVITTHKEILDKGALLVVDETRGRLRVLPLL